MAWTRVRMIFPTNPDLADTLGRTDFDFENFYFLFSWIPNFKISRSQVSKFPEIWPWARLGLGLGPGLPGLGPSFWARAWARALRNSLGHLVSMLFFRSRFPYGCFFVQLFFRVAVFFVYWVRSRSFRCRVWFFCADFFGERHIAVPYQMKVFRIDFFRISFSYLFFGKVFVYMFFRTCFSYVSFS